LEKEFSSNFFHFNNMKIELHPEVYEPAEDTFQILETIKVKEEEKIFEIGTGCGIIALECCRLGANVLCSDINPYAVDIVKKNYNCNKKILKGDFKVKKGDLFSVLSRNEKFDKIIFNPPYLPTNSKDFVGGSGWFDIATDGGKDGLEITERYLSNVGNYLYKNGYGYFIFSSLSDRVRLESILEEYSLSFSILNKYRFDNELLEVYQVSLK